MGKRIWAAQKPRSLHLDDRQIRQVRDPLAFPMAYAIVAHLQMLKMLGLHSDAREEGLYSLSFTGIS